VAPSKVWTSNTKVPWWPTKITPTCSKPIYDRHITDERTAQAVIRAALDSLAIDRAYRSALATGMAREIEESAAA